jgi:NAD(P)-dependent dehydrogenase (short-subunit alcohol dehydrogenase family)
MRLSGKVALISGGARGMGAVEARLFTMEKAKVVIGDVLDADGRAVEAEITRNGGEAVYVHLDVTSEADWKHAVETAVNRFGKLDVLVNNAGVGGPGRLEEVTLAEWNRVMDINSTGVFLGTRTAIPAMRRAGGGSIVNTASFVALMGAATAQIAYTASKGAVLAMTREIAVAHAKQGIRANSLCPGPVNTPLLQELYANDPEKAARRLVHLPMGRFAEAREIAFGALFLASDESSYVTAQTFLVDGGMTVAYVTPE